MPVIPAEKRIDGMYGEVWVSNIWWADLVDITGTITVERKAINPAGSTQTYNKRGRVTREGTCRFDKVDSRHEKKFIESVNKDITTRRAARGTSWFPKFNMVVILNDPDAWGAEQITLGGCEFWTLPIGFSLGEMRQTELQFTWETESFGTNTANVDYISPPAPYGMSGY